MQIYCGSSNATHVRDTTEPYGSCAGNERRVSWTGSTVPEGISAGALGIYHQVRQGEHLSRIAQTYGGGDYRHIWEYARNADLCKKRQNPNVLFPGDILFIPARTEKQEHRATGKQHTFAVGEPTLLLRIVRQDVNRRPLGDVRCVLRVMERFYSTATDSDGQMEKPIPLTTEQASMTILGEQGIEIDIRVGHLDPVTEPSGWWARLINLGYYLGPANTIDPDALRSAVEEFQCDQGLTVDGFCGPKTQNRLKEAHGC